MPKTLEVDCDSHCKWSSLEPRSLPIALLDWTIRQKGARGSAGTFSFYDIKMEKKEVTVNYFYDILVLIYFVL